MHENRLRDLREDLDLTQQQVADALKLPRRTYCNYENAMRNIPNDILCRIADFYDTTTDYLLGRTDHRVPPR